MTGAADTGERQAATGWRPMTRLRWALVGVLASGGVAALTAALVTLVPWSSVPGLQRVLAVAGVVGTTFVQPV